MADESILLEVLSHPHYIFLNFLDGCAIPMIILRPTRAHDIADLDRRVLGQTQRLDIPSIVSVIESLGESREGIEAIHGLDVKRVERVELAHVSNERRW